MRLYILLIRLSSNKKALRRVLNYYLRFNRRESWSIILPSKRISALSVFKIIAFLSLYATAKEFLANPLLHQEVFGPYSIIVKCIDINEMEMNYGNC